MLLALTTTILMLGAFQTSAAPLPEWASIAIEEGNRPDCFGDSLVRLERSGESAEIVSRAAYQSCLSNRSEMIMRLVKAEPGDPERTLAMWEARIAAVKPQAIEAGILAVVTIRADRALRSDIP